MSEREAATPEPFTHRGCETCGMEPGTYAATTDLAATPTLDAAAREVWRFVETLNDPSVGDTVDFDQHDWDTMLTDDEQAAYRGVAVPVLRAALAQMAATPEPTDPEPGQHGRDFWEAEHDRAIERGMLDAIPRAATPEPTDPAIWADRRRAIRRGRATPEPTDLLHLRDRRIAELEAGIETLLRDRDAHRCTVDEAALAEALMAVLPWRYEVEDDLDVPYNVALADAAAIAARLRGES